MVQCHKICLPNLVSVECIGNDYTAYMDYMDTDVHCPKKTDKLCDSLTHSVE